MYRLKWISYFVSINERHSKCLYNGILSSICGIHIQIWLIKGASKKNKLGHRDMREIVNIEELILKIQKSSTDCGLKPRRMNIKPTLRDQ